MDTAEALFLARAQFGLNIGFHILFPSLTIALGWLLQLERGPIPSLAWRSLVSELSLQRLKRCAAALPDLIR